MQMVHSAIPVITQKGFRMRVKHKMKISCNHRNTKMKTPWPGVIYLMNLQKMFWKTKRVTIPQQNAQLITVEGEEEQLNTDTLWLKNNPYHLKKADNYILLSKTAWLNDSIMDAA